METVSVIKILTENGTVRYGIVDKFGAPTVLQFLIPNFQVQ